MIAFFELNQHVAQFVETEVTLAENLKVKREDLIYSSLSKCSCDILKSGEDFEGLVNSGTCDRCNDAMALVTNSKKFSGESVLSSYASPDDRKEVEDFVATVEDADKELLFRNVRVGEIALHDVLLVHKRDFLDFREDPILLSYRTTIAMCCYAIMWFERFYEKFRFDRLVVYNSHYSINHAVCDFAEELGLDFFAIHGGPSHHAVWTTLMMSRGDIDQHKVQIDKQWKQGYDIRPLDAREVDSVSKHFDVLFGASGSHCFSSAAGSGEAGTLFNRFDELGVSRVFLAATNSSDERFALEESGIRSKYPDSEYLFRYQTDWIEWLRHFFTSRPDYGLIIRVHPREFGNHRSSAISASGKRLESLLSDLPENIIVNWPEEKISVYDLMRRIDMMLTCWSQAAVEASIFGSPIVLPKNPVRLYQSAADVECESFEEYEEAIKFYVDEPWTLERSIQTFRWLWLVQFASCVSLERNRTPRENKLLRRICNKVERIENRILGRAVLSNRMRLIVEARPPNYVAGMRVIQDCLLGEFDPLSDFDAMNQLQKIRGSGSSLDPIIEGAEMEVISEKVKELILRIANEDVIRSSSSKMATLFKALN